MVGRYIKQQRAWTPAEVDRLQAMVGQMPFCLVIEHWNAWAEREGIPIRTPGSLGRMADRLGDSRMPDGKWVGVGEVARALGRHPSVIWRWCRRGMVAYCRSGNRSAIKRASLRKLARKMPEAFCGSSRDGLLYVLEDAQLADAIRRDYPERIKGRGNGSPVRCIERDVVFPSCSAAGKALHMSESTVRLSLRTGKPVAGLRFERAD